MDAKARLDELLIQWHTHRSHYKGDLGFPAECPYTREFRSSNQWDGCEYDEDGEVFLGTPDALIRGIIKYLTGMIETLQPQHQWALAYEARALAVGSHAIKNPRLPQDPKQLRLVVIEARGELAAMLGDLLFSIDD